MTKKKKIVLFKDNIKKNEKAYCKAVTDLLRWKENNNLKKLIKGVNDNRKNDDWNHEKCDYVKEAGKDGKVRNTEKRICRCFRFDKKECNNDCLLIKTKFSIDKSSRYKVVDYEVPTKKTNKINSIGCVDLIIKDKNNDDKYIVEVKPKTNNEPLLRMIAEILTYKEAGVEHYENAKPAIAFFENSFQEKEYERKTKSKVSKARDEIDRLLKEIEVFEFKKKEGNNFEIINYKNADSNMKLDL